MRCFSLLPLLVICLTACSDAKVTEVSPEFLSLSIESGEGQTGLPGQPLPGPVVVRVERIQGKRAVPESGVLVNFVVTQGGGSVYAGAGLTDGDGIASDWWTLGPKEGPNELEVRAVHGVAGVKEMYGRFTATAADNEGPVTRDLSVDPGIVGPGQGVSLGAIIDETTTGGSTIASAEFNLDGGPWTPMAPLDGAFDEATEDVEGTLTAQGALGQTVTVCVRGSDARGNAGNAECGTFTIEDLVGPTATSLFFLPAYGQSGGNVTFYGDVDDTSTGASTISFAEYSVNGGPWQAMSPSDGDFDEPLETVQSSVPASGQVGDYMVFCARGTDAVSNVGDLACAFLTIVNPLASLKGYLTPSGTGVVLDWGLTPGAVAYRIEIKLASWPDDAWEVYAIYSGEGNTFLVTENYAPFGLSEVWDFRVIALNVDGDPLAVSDMATVIVP